MFNSELTTKQFLKEYWQKKPYLFRNAFPSISPPISAEELAGLSCEEGSNARLIQEIEEKPYWKVEYSPIEESTYQSLPAQKWTLLVTDVDKIIEEARDLLDQFRFIPDWRIDDLMISYAVDGGSVGPHVDAYDVFLIQTLGHRHWYIGEERCDGSEELLPDIDLKVLKDFSSDTDWLLEPGDMLYLPPGIAHHGVARGECMTCSVGFRAPSLRTIVSEYVEHLASTLPQQLRYTDQLDTPQKWPAEITDVSIVQIKQLLDDHLIAEEDSIAKWFGEYSTSKSHITIDNDDEPNVITSLASLPDDVNLYHSLNHKMLFKLSDDKARLFVDGSSHETSASFAKAICNERCIPIRAFLSSISDDQDTEIALKLINDGVLRLHE